MSTIFSKIINKEILVNIVYEDDLVLAFKDITPQAPIHIIIIPKVTDLKTLNDINEKHITLLGHIVFVAIKIAKSEGISENGYRIVMNCNADGGQSIFHIHLHLLGGREMNWPPG